MDHLIGITALLAFVALTALAFRAACRPSLPSTVAEWKRARGQIS